jgi:hypothetical protein
MKGTAHGFASDSRRILTLAALAALGSASCGDTPSAERTAGVGEALNGPTAWIAASLVRVGRHDPAGAATDAKIYAGRSEYESFQIVVKGPSGGLTHANATVSTLTGPGGATIPSSDIALFREQYTTVTSSSPNWGGSNQPMGAGEYPDGLIPFVDPSTGKSLSGSGAPIVAAPFSVADGENQPLWVDVYVPPATPAGTYAGTYSVSSDQGAFMGNVSVRVWAFTLPAKPTMKSSFLFWSSAPQETYAELLRNKLDPLSVPAADEGALVSQFGLESAGLPFFSGADVGNCTMGPPPSVASIQSAAATHQAGVYLYTYSADEIGACTGLYPTVQAWGLAMHQAGVDNLVTMAPVPQLFDDGSGKGRSAVDDWTVLPVTYDGAKPAIAQALAKGDHIWSYNTLVQDAYSPKWEIDFAPLNFRIQPGFISATLSLTGILYWKVDRWTPDPWVDVNNAGTYSSSNYPGEAQLLYPGQDVGMVGAAPSMRLRWLRDGVEDFDYVALLEQAGKGAWALQEAATVGADWTNWTRDPAALESVREALGNALDQMGGGGSGDGGAADGGAAGSSDAGTDAPGSDSGDSAASDDSRGAPSGGCACSASEAHGGDERVLPSALVLGWVLGRRRRGRDAATCAID